MIDFRYHVVSIVAIFLALTVGLVIGASILSKGVADSLRSDLSQRNDQINSQQNQIKQLETQIDQQNKYISATADALVSDRLIGQCVALVQLAGADNGAYSAVRTMVQKQAGASICSDTTINAALTAVSSQDQLSALVKEHTPIGDKLTGAVTNQAAELIAEALTTYETVGTVAGSTPTASATPTAGSTKPAGGATSPAAGSSTSPASTTSTASTGTMTGSEALATLKDFQNAGMITMTTLPVQGEVATLAYLQAPTTTNNDADNQAYLALAEALRKGGASPVVGGSGQSADKGGLVYAIIRDATATREISTVDDTDVTMGQVASVFCLYDQSQGGTTVAGHYGTGANNDGPIPPITAGLG